MAFEAETSLDWDLDWQFCRGFWYQLKIFLSNFQMTEIWRIPDLRKSYWKGSWTIPAMTTMTTATTTTNHNHHGFHDLLSHYSSQLIRFQRGGEKATVIPRSYFLLSHTR